MRSLLAAALLASGCSVKLGYSGTSYACPDGETCPGGYECIDFECIQVVPDAPPLPDGPVYDAPPLVRCNSVTLVGDDFEDGSVGPEWDVVMDSGTSVSESAGQLVIGLASNMSGILGAGYGSWDWYDLRDGRFFAEAVDTPNSTTVARMAVVAAWTDEDYLFMGVVGGQLIASQTVAGAETVLRTRGYNPNPHRFWALREEGGTVYFETSGDGDTWASQIETPAPFDLQFVKVGLLGITTGSTSSPGQAIFDNFNDGQASGERCPASSLVDDFEDGEIAHAWARAYQETGCTIEEVGGQVVITPSTTQVAYCGYGSSSRYDLRDDSVTVTVAEVPTGDAQAFLGVDDPTGKRLQIIFEGGMLVARSIDPVGGTTVHGMVAYDAAAHRLWRIRVVGSTATFEASSDGELYAPFATADAPIDFSAVLIELSAGTWTPTPIPGVARFEGFNVP
jgi:hypothetical protein